MRFCLALLVALLLCTVAWAGSKKREAEDPKPTNGPADPKEPKDEEPTEPEEEPETPEVEPTKPDEQPEPARKVCNKCKGYDRCEQYHEKPDIQKECYKRLDDCIARDC